MHSHRLLKCYVLLSALFYAQLSTAESISFEWAPFIKLKNVSTHKLIENADAVSKSFLIQQPGFIKRELIQKDKDTFADVIYWESVADAQQAAEKVSSCNACLQYFSLMDSADNLAQSTFSYYQILKAW